MSRSTRKSTARTRADKARDPILSAIEAHSRAALAVKAACGPKDIPPRLMRAMCQAEERMFATVPTTPAGVRALAQHVLKFWRVSFEATFDDDVRPLFVSLSKAARGR